MVSYPTELRGQLYAALDDERRRHADRLDALLLDMERHERWLAVPLPEGLAECLSESTRGIAVEIAALLREWRRMGGEISLAIAADALPAADSEAGAVWSETPEPAVAQAEPAEAAPAVAPAEPAEAEPLAAALPIVPPASAKVGPPASPAALAALKAHVRDGGAFQVAAPVADGSAILAEAIRALLPGAEPAEDIARIRAVVDGRDRWVSLPRETVAPLMELAAARLRVLQLGGSNDHRIHAIFGALSAYSKTERPGFVWGLSRDHAPKTGSWEGDADAALDVLQAHLPETAVAPPALGRAFSDLEAAVAELDCAPPHALDAVREQIRAMVAGLLAEGVPARHTRLVRIVAGVAEEVLPGPQFRSLRRAARECAAPVEEEGPDASLPKDWPWFAATRGRRFVMVGGDPREPNRVRLAAAFGFAELAWEHSEGSRNSLQKVRDRVRAGGVDGVLLLSRFVGHDADEVIQPACREAGVPFVPVKTGYGVTGIRTAIERYLVAPVRAA